MEMERDKTYKMVSMIANVVAILSGLMIIISMFMPYLSMNVGNVSNTLGSGFNYMMNKDHASSSKLMACLVLVLIFALAHIIFGLLRLLRFPVFNTKIIGFIYGICGLALIVLAALTFQTFVNHSSLDLVSNGSGLLVMLIFSILGGLGALVSAVTTIMWKR